jgi:hypothetical protein
MLETLPVGNTCKDKVRRIEAALAELNQDPPFVRERDEVFLRAVAGVAVRAKGAERKTLEEEIQSSFTVFAPFTHRCESDFELIRDRVCGDCRKPLHSSSYVLDCYPDYGVRYPDEEWGRESPSCVSCGIGAVVEGIADDTDIDIRWDTYSVIQWGADRRLFRNTLLSRSFRYPMVMLAASRMFREYIERALNPLMD